MSFFLAPASAHRIAGGPSSSPPQEPIQRPATRAHGPTGVLPRRSSTGPAQPLRHSPPGASAAPASGGNPSRQGRVQEFPARRLAAVMRECRALPNPLVVSMPAGIAGLSVEELRLLEHALRRRLLHGLRDPAQHHPSQDARDALRAWLMVQAARLHRPGSAAQDAALCPAHAAAFNDFLELLHPSAGLPPAWRNHVTTAFNFHDQRTRRLPPQLDGLLADPGIMTLAEQGYRLDGRTGTFVQAEAGWPIGPDAAGGPDPDLVLRLPSTPRPRRGKLPDSEQYRHIKSMTPGERAMLESSLETRFMQQDGPAPSDDAQRALEAWLTTQQVRLRVHSDASLQRHAQALRSPLTGLEAAAAALGLRPQPGEFLRFHSEHESVDRPEYAIAVNNFLRILKPSPNPSLHPVLAQRVTERLIHHAEVEGTLSAPVLEALRQQGPHALAAANWRLDGSNNVFSPGPVVFTAPRLAAYWLATPAPLAPAGSTGPGPGMSRDTPASAPAPR